MSNNERIMTDSGDNTYNHARGLAPVSKEEKQRVLKAFFRDGRLVQSPAKMSKRNICYRIILEKFELGLPYPEKEVNEIISAVYDDYCEVRRHFIDFGWMERKRGIYTRIV